MNCFFYRVHNLFWFISVLIILLFDWALIRRIFEMRMRNRVFVLGLLFLVAAGLAAEERDQKTVGAVPVHGTVLVDGRLDEEVWKTRAYSGFLQRDPNEGELPTEKTLVWVAYDEKHLYVAARMFDSEPKKITSRLGRRDDFVDSDWFVFCFYPYYDKRSGYRFALTPAGTIFDQVLFNDEWDDSTWDGIWKGATQIDSKGWTVEMQIPFHQLRFKKKEKYVWGVNFHRLIKRKNEELWYELVKKDDSGYVSKFAKLVGINGIKPGRHIELLPYAVRKAEFSPEEEGNPFETGEDFLLNAGIDFKWVSAAILFWMPPLIPISVR